MKYFSRTLPLLAVLLLVLAGCRTMKLEATPAIDGETLPDGRPITYRFKAENWGLFLFNWLPVATGNPNRPNAGDYYMGSDWLHPSPIKAQIRKEARHLKAGEVEFTEQTERETGMFSLWLVWLRVIQVNAVAVKPAGKEKP